MSGFGQTPLSTTPIGVNQFPVSAVAEQGRANGDLTALEAGPGSVDSNGNRTAPMSTYVKAGSIVDGGDVVQGATTDAAVTSDASGTISAKLRGLVKIFADVWDSVGHRIKVDGSGVTQPISAASLPLPTGAALDSSLLAILTDTADIEASVANIPALGQALAAASVPVVLTAAQQTALTPPAAITGFALEAGHLATIDTNIAAILTDTADIETNTTGLALESGGNLATIVTQTATPNVSDRWARQLGQMDLARVLGAALSNTNPVLFESNIQNWTRAGQQVFSGTTGILATSTNTNLSVGAGLFNNSTGKNMLIFSIMVLCSNTASVQVTTNASLDANFGTTYTPLNQWLGSATAAVGTFKGVANNVSTGSAATGTTILGSGVTGNVGNEMLTNGRVYLLPSGAANAIQTYFTVTTAGNKFAISYSWVEF